MRWTTSNSLPTYSLPTPCHCSHREREGEGEAGEREREIRVGEGKGVFVCLCVCEREREDGPGADGKDGLANRGEGRGQAPLAREGATGAMLRFDHRFLVHSDVLHPHKARRRLHLPCPSHCQWGGHRGARERVRACREL